MKDSSDLRARRIESRLGSPQAPTVRDPKRPRGTGPQNGPKPKPRGIAQAMSVLASVIIPVLDQEDTIDACLRSVLDQSLPADRYEVIVVDNGSSDTTREKIAAHPVISLSEPRASSYAARNRGVQAARGEVLAFLDADCRADRGWLERGLVTLGRENKRLVAGAVETRTAPIPNVFEIYDHMKYLDQESSVGRGYAATANFFIRRGDMCDLGGFDGDLVSSGDRELCLRAGRRGYELVFERDAVVSHPARADLGAILRKNERLGYGVFQLLARRPGEILRMFPMLLFMIPRRRFLVELLRRRPACRRPCLLILFLVDWLAKQSMVLGCAKAAFVGGRRPRARFGKGTP